MSLVGFSFEQGCSDVKLAVIWEKSWTRPSDKTKIWSMRFGEFSKKKNWKLIGKQNPNNKNKVFNWRQRRKTEWKQYVLKICLGSIMYKGTGLKLQIKTTLLCMGPFLIIPCIHLIIVKKNSLHGIP